MIALWGPPDDGPLAAVAAELDELGVPYVPLEPDAAHETELDLVYDGELRGAMTVRGLNVPLETLRSMYVRPGVTGGGALGDALAMIADLTPATVVNRPAAMASNGSKPFQLDLIAEWFPVPETIVTTDRDVARAFWQRHHDVIYKSTSAVRSVVSKLGAEHEARLDDLASCPTQLQRYVPGTDHRVHVVGHELFATEIDCAADDYRYAREAASPRFRPAMLPERVAMDCVRAASGLGLLVAGIDLRRDPQGGWWCFEVNPSPAFDYYEEATGQPIARAVARLLAAPRGP